MKHKFMFWKDNPCKKEGRRIRIWFRGMTIIFIGFGLLIYSGCGIFSTTYKVTKGVVNATIGAGKIVYEVGEFTFSVVMAPLTWPLTREEIETIDGLPPKEAIKKGRVKKSPYVVNGKRYVPMSVKKAKNYREKGIASWYGYETRKQKGGAHDCKRRGL